MQSVLFRQGTIPFREGGNGPKSKTMPVELNLDARTTIYDATVFVRGYDVTFTNGDHNVQQLNVEVDLDISNDRKTLTVSAKLLLRDSNGDDPFVGSVAYSIVVITEFVPAVVFATERDRYIDFERIRPGNA